MRTATRLLPAILILAGFFLIRIYLYRLPISDAFQGSNFKSLVGAGDDTSTKVNEAMDLASTSSAPNDGRIEATATAQSETSSTTTVNIQEQTSPAGTSPNSLDQVVVIGKIESEDTSWVEKLPTSVFSAASILPYDKC